MPDNADIVISDREQLLYTLSEASEIEHNLMCCYLYAAWSLRTEADDDIDADSREEVRRWQRSIFEVAVDEMAHLALAANLMNAVGGTAHFQRPNFPIAPGYHPAGLQVHLAPFNRSTLQHFIYLERPEGSAEPDGEGFDIAADYRRGLFGLRLMPSAQDFPTVGHLYNALDAALSELSERIGEHALFCGDPALQVGPDIANLPGLIAVTDLASARQALRTIVEQGEGSPADSTHSHFQRFIHIRQAHEAMLARKPDFVAAYPAANNPVMRRPPDPTGKVWIQFATPQVVLDLGNSVYNLLLRFLASGFTSDARESKRLYINASIDLMFALGPLARELARLKANDTDRCNAGLSFATLRNYALARKDETVMTVLIERLGQLRTRHLDLPASPRIDAALKVIDDVHARLVPQVMKNLSSPNPDPLPATHVPSTQAVHVNSSLESPEVVPGKDLTLIFDGKRCIHARFCVTGAPQTFLANVVGPWLHPDQTSTDRLIEVAHACPSGAVAYQRHDGKPDETAPPVNLMTVREAGPYAFHAALSIPGQQTGFRATLCRCGASKNKPFCDGSHHDAGFTASGEPDTVSLDPLPMRDGNLQVDPLRNGPLHVTGNLEICSGTGRVVQRVTEAKLCRCGHSRNKPFCDGTHRTASFVADGS